MCGNVHAKGGGGGGGGGGGVGGGGGRDSRSCHISACVPKVKICSQISLLFLPRFILIPLTVLIDDDPYMSSLVCVYILREINLAICDKARYISDLLIKWEII